MEMGGGRGEKGMVVMSIFMIELCSLTGWR